MHIHDNIVNVVILKLYFKILQFMENNPQKILIENQILTN